MNLSKQKRVDMKFPDGMLSEAIREAVKMRRRKWKLEIVHGDGGWLETFLDGPDLKKYEPVDVIEMAEGDILLTREEVERVREALKPFTGDMNDLVWKKFDARDFTPAIEALDLLNAKRGSGSEEKTK